MLFISLVLEATYGYFFFSSFTSFCHIHLWFSILPLWLSLSLSLLRWVSGSFFFFPSSEAYAATAHGGGEKSIRFLWGIFQLGLWGSRGWISENKRTKWGEQYVLNETEEHEWDGERRAETELMKRTGCHYKRQREPFQRALRRNKDCRKIKGILC